MIARCISCNKKNEFSAHKGSKISGTKCPCGGSLQLMIHVEQDADLFKSRDGSMYNLSNETFILMKTGKTILSEHHKN